MQMPNDILSQLFYGQLDPWENSLRDRKEQTRLNMEMSKLWETIESKVDGETKELLEHYLVLRSDMSMMYQCDHFKTGFQLGVQFLLAALASENGE